MRPDRSPGATSHVRDGLAAGPLAWTLKSDSALDCRRLTENFLLASNGSGYVDEASSFALDDGIRQMLKRSVLIAQDDGGPGVCWLLYLSDAAEDGEWAAYEWFTGDGSSPDDHRYDNFGSLLLRVVVSSGPDRTRAGSDVDTSCRGRTRQMASGRISPMRLDRLDHLALIGADQDATIDFYTRVLGMEAVTFGEGRTASPSVIAKSTYVLWGRTPETSTDVILSRYRWAVLRCGRPGAAPARAAVPSSMLGSPYQCTRHDLQSPSRDPDRNPIKLSNDPAG